MVSLVDDTAAAAIKNQDTLCAISEALVEDSRSLRNGESASLHPQEVSLRGNKALPSFMTVLGPFELGVASNRAWVVFRMCYAFTHLAVYSGTGYSDCLARMAL